MARHFCDTLYNVTSTLLTKSVSLQYLMTTISTATVFTSRRGHRLTELGNAELITRKVKLADTVRTRSCLN